VLWVQLCAFAASAAVPENAAAEVLHLHQPPEIPVAPPPDLLSEEVVAEKCQELRTELVSMIDSLRESIDQRVQIFFEQKMTAEALKSQRSRNHRESSPDKPPRTNAFRGRLPHLPPSSLALEEVDPAQRSRPYSGKGPPGPVLDVDIKARETGLSDVDLEKQWEEEMHAESKEVPEEDVQRQQQKAQEHLQDQLTVQLQQLQQRQFLPLDDQPPPAQPLKQRHLPPSGGGFRRVSLNSRPRTAGSRPVTARR